MSLDCCTADLHQSGLRSVQKAWVRPPAELVRALLLVDLEQLPPQKQCLWQARSVSPPLAGAASSLLCTQSAVL